MSGLFRIEKRAECNASSATTKQLCDWSRHEAKGKSYPEEGKNEAEWSARAREDNEHLNLALVFSLCLITCRKDDKFSWPGKIDCFLGNAVKERQSLSGDAYVFVLLRQMCIFTRKGERKDLLVKIIAGVPLSGPWSFPLLSCGPWSYTVRHFQWLPSYQTRYAHTPKVWSVRIIAVQPGSVVCSCSAASACCTRVLPYAAVAFVSGHWQLQWPVGNLMSKWKEGRGYGCVHN